MSKKEIRVRFFGLLFLYFGFFALFWGYALPIYISELELSVAQKGFVLAIASLSGVFGSLTSGYLADRFKTIKKIQLMFVSLFVISVGLLFVDKPLALGFANVALIGFFAKPGSELLENWVIEYSDDTKDHFGPIRAFGSLGWAVVNTIVGGFYTKLGFHVVPYFLVVGLVIYVIYAITMPDVNKRAVDVSHVDEITVKDIKKIFHPQFILLILIIVIYMMTFNVYFNSMILKFEMLDESRVATYWGYFLAIAAFSEIAMFVYSKVLVTKIKPTTFLLTSAVFMGTVPFFVSLVNDPKYLVGFAVFNMMVFAPFLVGSKRLVDDLASGHVRTTTQTVSLASQTLFITFGLSQIGILADTFGVNGVFPIVGVFGLISVGLILFYRVKYKH